VVKEALDVFTILFCCLDKFLLFEKPVGGEKLLSVKLTIRIISELLSTFSS